MTYDELDEAIIALDGDIRQAFKGNTPWKEVWGTIREISTGFKGARYPSREAHQEAWSRFQGLVSDVTAQQEEANKEREKRYAHSSDHLDKIKSYAVEIEWDSELEDQLLGIVSVGLYDVMKGMVGALTMLSMTLAKLAPTP